MPVIILVSNPPGARTSHPVSADSASARVRTAARCKRFAALPKASRARLLNNIDHHAHVAVVGATEVVANSDVAPDSLRSDGDLSGLPGEDVAIDLQRLVVEAVGHVFGNQLDGDGLTFFQVDLGRDELKPFGGDLNDARITLRLHAGGKQSCH